MTTEHDIADELRAIRTALESLPDVLAQAVALAMVQALKAPKSRRVAPRREGDQARIEELLPELHRAIGQRTFVVGELAVYAAKHVDLRDALESCDLNGKQLGKLFARFAGEEINGFAIIRQEKSSNRGALWRVRECE